MDSARKPKRTLPETLMQIQRLKIRLLDYDHPIVLGQIKEDTGLNDNEAIRALDYLDKLGGLTKTTWGGYQYLPTEADVELASAIYERLAQLAQGAEKKMQQVYPETGTNHD